eukprot:TRINITY_DN643_c0_g2_i1.p1 TRINITY_DN643_c0_g2~~TRINITY_DN643_c0_g2_i1.p1  ORF type:complete len:500 (+),score=95.03 TRINITY_DN643_c0_g2_i1:421-1920(+)
MALLADSFLADLDDLSDNDEEAEEGIPAAGIDGTAPGDDDDMLDMEELDYDNLDAVAKLQKSARYHDILEKVNTALQQQELKDTAGEGAGQSSATQTLISMDDPAYKLIVDCNQLIVDMDNEIAIVHNFIRDKYRLKFPELESLVSHPIDYARVVKTIGNEMDLTLINLEGLLPSATIMVVSVTASTTNGKVLPEETLEKTLAACERALELDESKKKVLKLVESRMGSIAPNLSAIVGSAIAAQLMGVAGGLVSLASMPSCNVYILGSKKKNLAGFSTATTLPHTGFVFMTEIVQSTPPALRLRACRLVAGKCTLAARVDASGADPGGVNGRRLRDEVKKKIEKWQEPPPAKQAKPLPVPDADPKKKRGGRRLRKQKERYAMTDMRKLANRMQFGIPEESSLGDGIGEGYGMLGQAGTGKLRVAGGTNKLAAKAKKFREKQVGSSGATSGLSSSLAFTPVQGIELTNPHAQQQALLGSGTQSTYFSETGTFSKIKRSQV